MIDATLFPNVTTAPGDRCRARREPHPREREQSLTDRLRWIDGRRVLTTSAGLTTDEIAELVRSSRFGPVEVRFRIPTPDRRLAAFLEPRAPSPSMRLASLRAARRAGLEAGVMVSPLIPGVNATEVDLVNLFAAARESGASFLAAEVVVPGPRRRDELRRSLRDRYPRVAARYEVWCRTAERPDEVERARLEVLLDELGCRFRLPRAPAGESAPPASGLQRHFGFAV